jgi:cytoskeletal protein RodZ
MPPARLRRPPEREAAPTFGETLRQTRCGRRLTLEDAERETRIPQKYLGALEDQDYGALPSSVYARGVLRSYATYLELEPEPLLDQFRPPRAREERSTIRPALPLGGAGNPISWSLVIGLLAIVGTVALTMYLYGQYVALSDSLQVPERPDNRGLDIPEPLVAPWTPLPRILPTPLVVAAPAAAEEAPPADAAPETPDPTAAPPAPAGGNAATPPAPAGGNAATPAATPSPAATPTVVPTPSPSPRPSAAVTVEARAVERAYMQVWADGRQVFAENVAPGTARTFTANDSLQMRVSNAGGVQVVVNGEAQGRLGASGQAVDVTWGRR